MVLPAVVLTVGACVVLAVLGIVGPRRLRTTAEALPGRLRRLLPSLLLLATTVAVSAVARQVGTRLSWALGWNVTRTIYALEGALVADVQSVATPALTRYFSAVYVVGYGCLLVFPLIAYAALRETRPFELLATAYATNYALGVCCYVLFVAYGPRNLIPDLVDPLLYAHYPQLRLVTSAVNTNTNVFPSLHASLSVTVATLSWWTREHYPRWTTVALPLAASVVVSTVYLGIHWVTDVVAGVVLAAVSLSVADAVVD